MTIEDIEERREEIHDLRCSLKGIQRLMMILEMRMEAIEDRMSRRIEELDKQLIDDDRKYDLQKNG